MHGCENPLLFLAVWLHLCLRKDQPLNVEPLYEAILHACLRLWMHRGQRLGVLGGAGFAGPRQIHTSVSMRVPFIPNADPHFEIPLGNAIASAISPVSVLHYSVVADRLELSVGCPSSSQTALADLVSTFRSAVVDINHLVQRRSTCPDSPHLPCFQIPGCRNSGPVHPPRSPVKKTTCFLHPPCSCHFHSWPLHPCSLCHAIILYRPPDVRDVRPPFFVDCLQDGMILISLRRFNLPIKRDHFISDLLWSFPPLAVFLMCLCLSRPPLYQNITDHLNPFWWDHYRERFVASLLFPNLPRPPLSSSFPLNGSSYPIIHLRPLSPLLVICSGVDRPRKQTPWELSGLCSFISQHNAAQIFALWFTFLIICKPWFDKKPIAQSHLSSLWSCLARHLLKTCKCEDFPISSLETTKKDIQF